MPTLPKIGSTLIAVLLDGSMLGAYAEHALPL
jgi:hypothetical protein